MNKVVRFSWCQPFAGLCVLLLGGLAWGSSTGLNNIPTTDIVPENVLVLQSWLNMAENEHTPQFVGFKYGAMKDLEFGVDWKANDRTHGHAMLQAKYAFDIHTSAWRAVVGFADLSDNREHNGDYFPYTATSLDLRAFRLHFGFAPQPHNERFFGGIDKMVTFLDRNLLLRADGIHINDKEDMLFSVGFLYELGKKAEINNGARNKTADILSRLMQNVALEGWVSKPSAGDKETYTLKLNYVIRF